MDVLPVARHKLMEDMRDGLIVLDVQNRIVDINPAAQEMTGISASRVGKSAETDFAFWPELSEIRRATVETRIEIRISQDPPRDVELRVSPLFDARQNLSGRLIVLQDITERKQAEETIRTYTADLERRVEERTAELILANRAKDSFLAAASHELRTPLSAIMGHSGILLDGLKGPLNQKQVEAVRVIDTSSVRLLNLVNNILDVSMLESGKIEIYPQPVRVEDVCQASLRFIRETAAKKLQTVNYVPAAGDPVIKSDPKRLKQILNSLLDNAVKFTPSEGTVTLRVEAGSTDNLICFSITDNGIGISPQDMKNLFKPFVQIDNRLSRQYEGAGLGLVITKKLVDLLGGNIQVDTEVGLGSCFTVTLPRGIQD
jgi:PAS domain S-box-containing protein